MFFSTRTSVVVLDYNRPDLTNRCLESLWRYNRLNIILVNSGSTDRRSYTGNVPFHYVKNNRGRSFSIGMNDGIKYASHLKSEYVVLLNNDAIVEDKSIELLERSLDLNDKLGMVASNRMFSQGMFIEKPSKKADGEFNNYELPIIKVSNNLTGFCLCSRVNLLKDIGGYDEKFIFG